MELHKAIKEIVVRKGTGMICNPQIINYLLDYQAFKDKPATKLIIRAIIDSGYAECILALSANTNGWQTKFQQYQHEFIDSCGYKEELAAYVFESFAYGIGLNIIEGAEPEIRPQFNVDSFFDIPEAEQSQQPASIPNQNQQKTNPTDLYTIALSFYNEGKYLQAKGFIEKSVSLLPSSSVPSNHLRLLGDIYKMIGQYEDAVKAYNECFSQKANEIRCSIDDLRDNLKQHKVKGFENIMFCYFFCLYCAERMNDAQWLQFVKGEARYGLMDAIKYCADNGINPIEDHFDIYFVDKDLLKTGDYLYEDGTFSHELSHSKRVIASVLLTETSEYEKSHGWEHGYIIPVQDNGMAFHSASLMWSTKKENLPFPHSHYTIDDINHFDEIKPIESEQYLIINDYNLFPAFEAVRTFPVTIPISCASPWFLPSVHGFKRISLAFRFWRDYNFILRREGDYWTSSQADNSKAVAIWTAENPSGYSFHCAEKTECKLILPIAAF